MSDNNYLLCDRCGHHESVPFAPDDRCPICQDGQLKEYQSAKLERAMAVVNWCIGYGERYTYADSLRAVLQENGFIDATGRRLP